MTSPGANAGLYVIVDPAVCGGRAAIEVAQLALDGGARVIQWRDKLRDKGDQLVDARAIRALCREHGAIFIINDHADLAMACGATGVHLGQHDLPIAAVRPMLGDAAIIGVSTNNADEARAAEAAGADYVAVGAIFATATKDVTRAASLDRLREVKAAVRVPVVAIGGINGTNIASVVAAGADAAAVISAVCAAADVREAAAKLAAAFVSRSG
jgi:thiamine-phosphate diphosphorylase